MTLFLLLMLLFPTDSRAIVHPRGHATIDPGPEIPPYHPIIQRRPFDGQRYR